MEHILALGHSKCESVHALVKSLHEEIHEEKVVIRCIHSWTIFLHFLSNSYTQLPNYKKLHFTVQLYYYINEWICWLKTTVKLSRVGLKSSRMHAKRWRRPTHMQLLKSNAQFLRRWVCNELHFYRIAYIL